MSASLQVLRAYHARLQNSISMDTEEAARHSALADEARQRITSAHADIVDIAAAIALIEADS